MPIKNKLFIFLKYGIIRVPINGAKCLVSDTVENATVQFLKDIPDTEKLSWQLLGSVDIQLTENTPLNEQNVIMKEESFKQSLLLTLDKYDEKLSKADKTSLKRILSKI